MTSEIGFNSTQFLQLHNDIRISSSSTFNAQEAYDNTFEDVLLDVVSNSQETKNQENKSKFYNLGVPAGFILDNSLLEEMEALEVSSNASQNNFNPYLLQ
jgi:Uma2 family endonuclease